MIQKSLVATPARTQSVVQSVNQHLSCDQHTNLSTPVQLGWHDRAGEEITVRNVGQYTLCRLVGNTKYRLLSSSFGSQLKCIILLTSPLLLLVVV